MTSKFQKFRGRKESGTFLKVPTDVLGSPNFCTLSTKAKALVLDIGAKYNGHNNGDLAAPWSWMKERGWRSKDTLQRAIHELLSNGIVELTRQGGLHGPNLYAFTWLAIDQSKVRLDVPATNVASGKWKLPAEEIVSPKTQCPPRSLGQPTPIVGAAIAKTA
ncbi:hypothetical protein [Dyella sp. Tek66A03]|uniref:hypothetical protein n=1 Tax=Dyella sp. Tek66A03 TaxID=3458298 RepID=UPI00403E8AAE